MTLLTLIQDAAVELGFAEPSSVFTSTDPLVQLLRVIASKEGRELARRFDWQILQKEGSFTTVPTNDQFMKVLLHFDGTDSGTTITDSNLGGSSHAWTANGNAQIDTAQSKFGGASGLFDGTGDYVTTPDHDDFILGSGDWTVDLWFRVNDAGGTLLRLAGQSDSSGTAATRSLQLGRSSGNVMTATARVGTDAFSVTGTTQFTNAVNTGWHHYAFVRTGDILKLFIDGAQEGGDITITGTVNDSASAWSVGREGEITTEPWNGWIDEFQLSVGIARWTENFTPPTQAYAAETQIASLTTTFTDFGHIVNGSMWDRTESRAIRGPLTAVEWQQKKAATAQITIGHYFRIRGGALLMFSDPPSGNSIYFEYISNKWCQSSLEVAQTDWAADTDTALVDEEIIRLGIIWRYRKAKGFDYGEDFRTYEMALQDVFGPDAGKGIVDMTGTEELGIGVNLAEGSWSL